MATSRPHPVAPGARSAARGAATATGALAYKNRRGDTYYLHQGVTKIGKPRFFVAKTVGPGVLSALPEGLEIKESANGVVSVCRVDTSANAIPASDIETVQAFLFYPYNAGYHRRGESHFYVSRGTGTWGPPMRVGVPSEVVQIRLVAQRKPVAGTTVG